MNPPIVRLFGLLLVLFAALVGFTSYWAVFDSASLKDNPENRRPLILEQTIKRGTIRTSDGLTVAQSQPVGGGKHPIYVRRYPQGSEFGNPVERGSSAPRTPCSPASETSSPRSSTRSGACRGRETTSP
jgi:hypothetical protein